MKTESKTRLIQWTIGIAIAAVGFTALMYLGADDDPEHPVSTLQFITIKGIALAVLYGCCKLVRPLEKRGLLPDFKDPQ